ncbi:hypothetical protein [uncultured Draconibacterium sp.]|uniref:hypothetical protein n=1 Tax=uncultured Draconibacterium sp. TaxID=1573823 RepID=UPI00321794D0
MKIKLVTFCFFVAAIFASCSDDEGGNNKLGGSTDLETNEVGYIYTLNGSVDNASLGSGFKATVTDKTGDVVEIQLEGNIASPFVSQLPSTYVNSNGKVTVSGKFINSTDGVGYVNGNGETSILVKYDAKVGDKWSYTTLGGKTLNREVISKSIEDDYYWGGMLIKVIEVEQNLPYPGFNKVVYSANHKFGLVGAVVTMEDGSVSYLSGY